MAHRQWLRPLTLLALLILAPGAFLMMYRANGPTGVTSAIPGEAAAGYNLMWQKGAVILRDANEQNGAGVACHYSMVGFQSTGRLENLGIEVPR